MDASGAFDRLKARYCVAAVLIAWYWQPGLWALWRLIPNRSWYSLDLANSYYGHAVLLLLLAAIAFATRTGTGWIYILGHAPARQDAAPIAVTVVLTFCASAVIVTATYVPLSYLLPDFVQWWLRWAYAPIIFIGPEKSLPVLPNLLNLVSVAVLTPVVEELVFRGYLLHRWANRWGLRNGVVLSSIAFGIIHPDAVAAMVTGVGFALLYLRTGSLWTAIIAHGIFNLIVWVWELLLVVGAGYRYRAYTIAQLRDDWWVSAVALVIALVVLDRLLRRKAALGPFALPAPARSSA